MELHVGGFYHPPPFTTSYMRSLVYMLGLEELIIGFIKNKYIERFLHEQL